MRQNNLIVLQLHPNARARQQLEDDTGMTAF
jgi:hypothetical protein